MAFHADRITLFVSSDNDARRSGLLDREEYVIAQILNHRGNFSNKRLLEFNVQWDGYGPEHNTWEPWSELRLTSQLHAYLRKIGQSKHIPHNL